MISLILADFGDAPVSVQAEHCLNVRHKGAGCQLCADGCPTDAIRLQMGRPYLDAERCVNCGLCLHACPTDVFTQRNAPEANLAKTASLLPDEAVALICPQHDRPSPTRAPVSTVVRHKRCLASLSVPQLLDLSEGGRRTIWLDDGPCAECPIGHVQPAIAQAANAAHRLLEAFDRPAAVRTPCENADMLADEPASRPVVDGDKPAVSRRGFFGALGQLARKTAISTVAEALPKPSDDGPVPVDQRLPRRIPPARGRLYAQLKRLGEPAEESIETTGLPFADIQVDAGACSACGLCARFCPTGALSRVTDAETFVLYLRSNICIDCGICAAACPEDAVSFGSQLAPSMLIDNRPQPLVAGPLAPCAGCGEPTAVTGKDTDEPRCYVCRHGTDPMIPLKDTAGLMADLTRHMPDSNTSTE